MASDDLRSLPDTVMWEAKATPGQQSALLDWVRATLAPSFNGTAKVYLGGVERVVMIADYQGDLQALPQPPQQFCARQAQCWPFSSVPAEIHNNPKEQS